MVRDCPPDGRKRCLFWLRLCQTPVGWEPSSLSPPGHQLSPITEHRISSPITQCENFSHQSLSDFAEAKSQIWHFIIISSQKDSLPHLHDYKQMILYFRSCRTFFLHHEITDQLVEMSWRLGFQLHLEVLRAGMVKPDAEVQVRKLCIFYAWTKLNQSSVKTGWLFTV